MSLRLEDVLALETLESRLRAILPEQYQYTYEDVLPVSMGSAGLKYGEDGRVAWNEIWATFCDLAMAGGPPHRGTLLEPAAAEAASAAVADEICRGISLVTGLNATADRCWVRVQCHSVGMAGWLVRAIVMENVTARHEGDVLFLPVGPEYRLAKEVKNVVTAIAKTCHYWTEHMTPEQRQEIHAMVQESGLLEPMSVDEIKDADAYRTTVNNLALEITELIGMVCFPNRYVGWVGVEFPSDLAAIWVMRALVVENILARREGTALFVPVTSSSNRLLDTLDRCLRLYAISSRK